MTSISRTVSTVTALTFVAAVFLADGGNAHAQEVSPDAPAPVAEPTPPPPPAEPTVEPAGPPTPAPQAQGWSWRATPPPAPVEYVPPVPRVDDGKGLRVAGWILFGVSYLATAYIGAMILATRDDSDSTSQEKAKAWYMFIPFGGSVAYGVARGQEIDSNNDFGSDEASRVVGFVLTIPAIVQTAGMILASVGHSKKKKASKKSGGFSLAPVGPAGSAGISIGGYFL